MKEIFTTIAMVLLTIVATAQDRVSYCIEVAPQLSPGISYRAGANISKQDAKRYTHLKMQQMQY